jgi:TPP-dependent pyruvate/acetoin dehydrogenase alpha subunit
LAPVSEHPHQALAPDRLLELHAAVLRVRLFEERVPELYAPGRLPGLIHLSIGQEAVAAGAAAALRPDDCVFSTHRGHGHLIAKGGSPRGLMAELYGKKTGWPSLTAAVEELLPATRRASRRRRRTAQGTEDDREGADRPDR